MTDPSWELVDSTMIVCKLQVLTSVDKVRVIQASACQDFSLQRIHIYIASGNL